MSTPPEHAPTEPVPPVATSAPPATRAPARAYDPIARIAQIVIAVVMVILLLLILSGYKFHVTSDKSKKDHTPRVTHSPKHSP